MVKLFNKGDIKFYTVCGICDKKFEGDKRTVYRAFRMHYKHIHGKLPPNNLVVQISPNLD